MHLSFTLAASAIGPSSRLNDGRAAIGHTQFSARALPQLEDCAPTARGRRRKNPAAASHVLPNRGFWEAQGCRNFAKSLI